MGRSYRIVQKIIPHLSVIISDTFLVSLFLYLAAVHIDLSLEGLISRAVPLNTFLLIVLLSGIAAVLLPQSAETPVSVNAPWRMWVYAMLISVFIGSIVTEILKNLSSWALLIGLAAAFVVFLVSFAIICDDSKTETEYD